MIKIPLSGSPSMSEEQYSQDSATDTVTGESPPAAAQPGGLEGLLQSLRRNTLVPLLLAAAAVIALIVALVVWSGNESYRVLFNNLGEADGGSIINELENRGIPYEIGAGGKAILVPADQVHVLRLQLAEQGLPQGGNVGFELMDNQDFGISQFAEQVNYQRSLEGELTRSIAAMSPVASARVHLSMAKPSVFIRDHEPAKASVILTLQGGRNLGQNQVNAIIHLVSSSVPELSPDNVTVVDQSGALLSGSNNGNGLDGDNLGYAQQLERRYQQRIENILSPLFGEDNLRIQVAADIDFSVREQTLEVYTPNQEPGTAAVRSSQLSGNYRNGEAMAQGIPGALSNSPPPVVAAATEGEEEGEEAQAEEDDDFQYDNIINYEVDRNITHIQHEQGRVQRLSVAAVINYRDGVDEEGNPVQVALSGDELAQVDSLIRQAMGFSEARGDELEVVNSPFTSDFNVPAPPPEWWTTADAQNLILALGRNLLIGLLALALFLFFIRPLMKRHLATAPAASVGNGPQAAPVTAVGKKQSKEARQPRERRGSEYEQDLQEVRNLAQNDPRLIAMVVKSWINKNG